MWPELLEMGTVVFWAVLGALAVIGAWNLARWVLGRLKRAWGARKRRKRVILAGTVMTRDANGKLRPWRLSDRLRPAGVLVMGEDYRCSGAISYPTPEVDATVVWVGDSRHDDQRQIDAQEATACPVCGAAVGQRCEVGGDGFHLAREAQALFSGRHRLQGTGSRKIGKSQIARAIERHREETDS